MSVTLAALVANLQADVPARDSVPSSAQYERTVKQAVRDLGRRVPLRKRASLSIVSGTAAYSLPADFLRLIKLQASVAVDGVVHTSEGLLPLNSLTAPDAYDYAINGTTLTFYPTPTFTDTWYVWYAAGYVLSEGTYADLDDERAEIALLRAQALALTLQANASAHHAWKYQAGDEAVDKQKLRAEVEAQAAALQAEYELAVRNVVGPVGLRGR